MEEIKRGYYDNGQVEYESYWVNEKQHRDDGPAYIQYSRDGNIKLAVYYKDGKRHRENGPAVIWYHDYSKNKIEMYFINGEEITFLHFQEKNLWRGIE